MTKPIRDWYRNVRESFESVYVRYILYIVIWKVYARHIPGIYLIYTFSISIYQAYTWYMTFWHLLGIWQVYTRWLVLWRWTWPHAARATSNHITGPCHYCNSFRFTTFAHFIFAHVSVHRPFRHKERRETPFFARIAHKVFHLGQHR